ncbi:MAG TPA: ferritin-like domain-containing protein [Candidatus Acidoferrales bacterium]|nr:ferritin-like domain-containing protein [Candidatus Acidoferrales bacterium]
MRIGSDEHKLLFCESFIASHRRYDATQLPWPDLSEDDAARLRAIPFWRTALAVETNAGRLVSAFAKTVEDPLIRAAVELQGREEARHAALIAAMIERYDIKISPRPLTPPVATRRAFTDFGYEECLDAYFGFGLFGVAQQVRYFSEDFMLIFEPLLHEETRHIVFFVNWVAYERARMKLSALAPALTSYGYLRALGRLIATARSASHDGTGFIATGSEQMISGLTLRGFLASCRQQNVRFMTTVDPRLLQPRVIPAIGEFLLRLVPSAGAGAFPAAAQ